jgi:hypothetical protein
MHTVYALVRPYTQHELRLKDDELESFCSKIKAILFTGVILFTH